MPGTGLLSLLEGSAGAATEVISTLLDDRGPKRVLTYESEVIPIIRTQQGFQQGMQVRYRGELVGSVVKSCRVVMVNGGSEALLDQPVLIQLKEGVTVLRGRITTIPEREFGEITLDPEGSDRWKRRYKVELMNPGNRICVDLTVAGEFSLSDITVVARGKGLKCVPKASYTLQQRRRKGMLCLIMALLAISALVVLIGPQIEWLEILCKGLLSTAILLRFSRASRDRQRPNKKLSYATVSLSPLYTVDSLYHGQVSVEYMGRPVENLHTCQVVLRNTGNTTLDLQNQGVLVVLKGATVLETDAHPEPELEFGRITRDALDGDSVKYHFRQFDPGDKVNIDLIFEGDIERKGVEVYAKGEMLRVEPEWQGTKYIPMARAASVVVWLVVVLAAAVLILSPRLSMDIPRSAIHGWFVDLSAEPGFWPGIIVGVVVFGTIAYTVFTIRVWWGNITAPLRVGEVWSRTGEAAARDLSRSLRSLALGLLVFACIVATLVVVLFPEALSKVLRMLGL